jgi:hypothetical protein
MISQNHAGLCDSGTARLPKSTLQSMGQRNSACVAVLHWRTIMCNVFDILDARMSKNFKVFSEGLDKTWRLTIANANRSDPRVSHVLDSLFDILNSHAKTQASLIEKHRSASDEESVAIEEQLDAGPLLVMQTFFEKVRSTSDVEDPVVLEAFEAAGQYLVQFLQLENEHICTNLDMLITHVQLRSDRQPRQEAEGTR